MIKKLRRQFILVAMVSMFVVLLTLVIAINVVNYRDLVSEADELLDIISANEGTIPETGLPGSDRPPDGGFPFSAELPFSSRYFTVLLGQDGSALAVNTEHIAAVDTDEALALAQSVMAGGKPRGYEGVYRYRIASTGSGSSLIIFLDNTEKLSFARTLMVISGSVGLLALAVTFLLIVLLSRRVTRPAAQSIEKQKQFITDAGHELKTPLTIISANAEVMELRGEGSEWLDSIKNQTERLSRLVNNLVLLSRMDEESASPRGRERFCVSRAVEDTAKGFSGLAEAQGSPFSADIAPELYMTGSEAGIKSLVSLLLDNAFKYSGEGGAVSLSLRGGKKLTLEIQNDCADAEGLELDRLFDRFYRADRARTGAPGGGYGLGLSVARSIAQSHGGSITAGLPAPDRVAFTVTLPAD